ncbi:MAG: cysteine--tRNA ligase [Pseudomonadales bacterium]|jgi:cysteinyl-tRNA synthetase|nr:cysteine--tRNA ligase [Pseudomonadales bacterium]
MQLYNTLSKRIEEVIPINGPQLGLYACGITAYDYAHIGNLRKYVMDDVLVRALRYQGFKVTHVQNVTDVGHLVSDGDEGEDKIEVGARKYGKSAFEIAREFEDYFFKASAAIGNLKPDIVARATDYIADQINIAKILEEKGYAYIIDGEGLYFDTSKFPTYGDFANLKLDQQQEGARASKIIGKKNPSDFALWKFEKPGENRAMSWSSPWSERGFPGWHLECVAISTHFLGAQFDIHTGGIDHIPVHHTNEIAEAECCSGLSPFVKYWVHHNHMRVEGQKMSKSLGNVYRLEDLEAQGYSPFALRYLFLTTHYRSEFNFTFENLKGAQKTYDRLVHVLHSLKTTHQHSTTISHEHIKKINDYRQEFLNHVYHDLDIPQALTMISKILKSNLFSEDKYDLIIEFDEILGLHFRQSAAKLAKKIHDQEAQINITPELEDLLKTREQAKKAGNYAQADQIRQEIISHGYEVEDLPNGHSKLKLPNT